MKRWYYIPLIILTAGCATYFQKTLSFHQAFESGRLEEAQKQLIKLEKKAEKGKARFIYLCDRGVVESLLGNYELSNQYLERAYFITEDYKTNYATEAGAFFTNPNMVEYKAEDVEQLLINYYKALNFLKMGKRPEALVEVRRMDIRLNRLNDKYSGKNKYQKDAFIQTMMGLIYDADGDVNNAFIAYKNAFEIYRKEYSNQFGVSAPHQLKLDLLHTAYQMGFTADLQHYEKETGISYKHAADKNTGEVVFVWHNGLSPVKSEWSVNFTVVKGQGGYMTFHNEELGLTFPAVFAGNEANAQSSLADLRIVRVAFPKYMERVPMFSSGTIQANGKSYPLEMGMPVNDIAFKTLEQRMLLEIGKGITRLAVKQAMQVAAREAAKAAASKENMSEEDKRKQEAAGNLAAFATSMINAATEKADTRAWMTTPHDIRYARISLPAGEHIVQLKTVDANGTPSTTEFRFEVKAGSTTFQTYHSMQGRVPITSYYSRY